MVLKNIKWNRPSSSEDPKSYKQNKDKRKPKWRTILALMIVYIAALLNWQWIWGIFLLIWIVPDFFTGTTYFVEPIDRKNHPILYWLILITWLAFSVVMFFPKVSAI